MTTTGRSVAIIPARGGSKRIPRKNIRHFRGRPMIAWSIEAALESGCFDRVIVSTDDFETASLAVSLGASVPFMRSEATSHDHATTCDVLVEVLSMLDGQGERFDLGCCLYATAPFVRGAALADGRNRLETGAFDVVMPVSPFTFPIWRSMKRHPDGRVELNFPENRDVRSQDLPPAFHDAGQWYWFRIPSFLRERVLMGPSTGSVVLPPSMVQDIDTEEDWELAELKHGTIFG